MQNEENPYLKLDVMGASPVRLRWMLISRASELCGLVESLWMGGDKTEANGWLLRIREILGELLGGVRDASNPLGKSVADFYVFLLKLLTDIEKSQSSEDLSQLKMLLDIEQETWHQVMLRESQPAAASASLADQQNLASHIPTPNVSKPVSLASLNLEV